LNRGGEYYFFAGMKFIIFIALSIALQTSLVIHIYSLVGYISIKKMDYFRFFMITAATNMFLSIGVATMVMIYQNMLAGINLDAIFILESGLLFVYMLAIKIRVTVVIIRRLRNPKNYHFSHFGKKIYNTTIIDFKELMTYFITFPFTIMAGAYFFVRLIRM
jgi:hypothetical protein